MAALPGNILSYNDESVETSTGDWTAFTNVTSIAQSVTHALEGTHALLVTATAAGQCEVYTNGLIAIAPAHNYWFYASSWSVTAMALALSISWYDKTGTFVSSNFTGDGTSVTTGAATQVASTWTQSGLLVTTPPAGVQMTIILEPTATGAAQTIWYDEMFFGEPSTGISSGPNYAGAAAVLAGGAGSWANTGNADGAPDASAATWTA